MPITTDEIRRRILAALPDADVTVEDTGGGDHFAATVVAAAFRDQGPVDRHRTIYAALGDAMRSNGPIHALALITKTPEEQERKRS
jgi:acid stress-induced BolA-like protein IbaG/YrbA